MPPTESVSPDFIGPCIWHSLVRYFVRGVQKFGLFWKMTSGVQLGSTVDTHSRVSLRSLRQSLVRRLPPGVQENVVVNSMRMLGFSMDTRACVSLWRWVTSHVFPGGPRIPKSMPGAGPPGNLDIISTGLSDHGGSWKNSCIFYVKVDSEWKGTSRICFRIQRCAWSDGSEFCGGAVHRTLEPEAPLVPLTESFTAEVLARRRVEQLIAHCSLKLLWSRRRSHSRRSRAVEQFMAPCLEYCTPGRVVGSSLRVRMRGRIRGSTVKI